MAKSFLILMLVTIQLLAGNGGSVSVCIKGDGSFCCFDQGSSDCSRCDMPVVQIVEVPEADVPKERSGCHCCCDEIETTCEPDSSSRVEKVVETTPEASENPCGCTQIVLTHDQASTYVGRTLLATDASYLIRTAFEVPALFGNDAAIEARQWAFQRFKPPPISSQAITVLSCVLIQC
jgi:hypothetical protein